MAEPKILTVKEIIALADDRKRKFAGRNQLYKQYLDYYFGRQDKLGGSAIRAMDSKGRPLLRYLGGAWENYGGKVVSNRVQPIVDDYQALLGRLPRSRVDPPKDSDDKGLEKAELLTKYLISTYDLSELALQQADAGLWLSDMGDSCYVLDVHPDQPRVVISVVNPMNAYPSFLRGFRRYQVADVAVVTIESPETIENEYGITVDSHDDEDCTVITYLSQWQRTVVVGNDDKKDPVAHVEHNLGWCPARWHFNKNVNGEYATSDVGQILALQDFYNFSMNVVADGLVEMTFPMRHIVNPQAFGEDQLEIGPGSTVVSDETGKINLINPTPPPSAALQLLERGSSEMMMGAGTTPVRMEGNMDSSIVTGRAMYAAQGPQATRIDMKQIALGYTYMRLNAMVLEMQEKAPFLKGKEFDIYGKFKGKDFKNKMKSSDIDGWYQNTVSWDAMVGISQQQKIVSAMQGYSTKLWDDVAARDMVGIDDPVGMRDRIEQSEIWLAGVQAKAQAALQPQGGGVPGGPPGIAQPGQAGPPGMMPPGQSGQPGQPGTGGGGPSMIFRPMQQPPKPPAQANLAARGGLPQGVTMPAIEMALQPIQSRLRGEVYATGKLARMGQDLKPMIMITDYKDFRLVKDTLMQIGITDAEVKASSNVEAIPDPKVRVG